MAQLVWDQYKLKFNHEVEPPTTNRDNELEVMQASCIYRFPYGIVKYNTVLYYYCNSHETIVNKLQAWGGFYAMCVITPIPILIEGPIIP